jgi:hypothetical protein
MLLYTFWPFFFLASSVCAKKGENNLNGKRNNLLFKFIFEITAMNSSTNLSQLFDQHMSKISNYCLSTVDFEKLYGNKSKFGLVFLFAPLIMDEACKQIGLNELRRQFHFKPQLINFTGLVEEKVDEDGEILKVDSETMNYFQKKVKMHTRNWLSDSKFWPEDVKNAERFLDHKFPAIRRLFQLKYNDDKIAKTLDAQLVDKLFLSFLQTRKQIFKALDHSVYHSSHALYGDETSNCYKTEV